METTKQIPDAATRKTLAEISVAYLEVLSGLRRPEQLARWVSDKFYGELTYRARRESISRQISGGGSRPTVHLVSTSSFPSAQGTAEMVSLVRIAGRLFAVTLAAAVFHGRLRVTAIDVVRARPNA